MGTSVFITGGSGLLAVNWAVSARNRCQVTLGLHERNIALAGIQARRISLESESDFLAALSDVKPHVVIHTAGLTDVDFCERNPALARHVNLDLSANVAGACRKAGVSLVHISTDHLFAGNSACVDEEQPASPVNVYGSTKAEAEAAVLDGCPGALVVRTNFYGWGTSYRRSFSDFIIHSLRNGQTITLFEDVFYTPIIIEALVNAVHDLVDMNAAGIFNIVGDDRISKYEFGLTLAREFGLDTGKISGGLITNRISDVKRPLDMSLSNNKIRELLGRPIGGVREQCSRLHQQERNGLSQELRTL